MKKMYLTVFSVLSMFAASATENPTKPTTEDPKPNPLKLSGYVDTYYFANFSGAQTNLGASGFEEYLTKRQIIFK